MAGIRTKRWNDPVSRDDGTRILITRYRPRGLRKDQENWESWAKQLAPSKELHAAAYGKDQEPISWDEYRTRYLTEVANHRATISDLAQQGARRFDERAPAEFLCERLDPRLGEELLDAGEPSQEARALGPERGAFGCL